MIDLEMSIWEQKNSQGNVDPTICKCRVDLDRYETIIQASEPDGIIEVGTWHGGSALWLADKSGAPVFTIDVADQVDSNVRAAAGDRVTFHTGRSTSLDTVRSVHSWMAYNHVRRPLVTLDGDHSYPTVRDELAIYAPLVDVGGYCVVEDGIIRWIPFYQRYYNGTPLDAAEEFLVSHPGWRANSYVEDLFATTQHPGGWLIRLR